MTIPIVLIALGAVFVALALASACIVGGAAAIAARWPRSPGRLPSTVLCAAVVFAPAALAVLGCAALAFPNPYAPCHCTAHGLHHPHFCAWHPDFALPMVIPGAYLLGIWFALAAPGLYRLGRESIVSARWARAVLCTPMIWLDGTALRLADCAARGAFTIGTLSPIIVFDRVLWQSLSEDERRAVVHHERCHVERRDGLTLFVLRLCMALFPMPGSQRLLAAWRTAVEHVCDRHAAAKLGNPAAVAAALVAVERIRARSPQGAAIPAPALGALAGADLARRVLSLLECDDRHGTQPPPANDVLATAIVVLGALVLAIAWPGTTLHHAIETLLGHFVR